MALTNDNSNRLMVFDGGSPIKNTDKYIWLKNSLKQFPKKQTLVDSRMVDEIFSPVKDPFSGYTVSTSHEQFVLFCKQNNIDYMFSDVGFLVKWNG